MRRSAAGAALTAAIGFSALTAAPASAAPFVDCDAAAAAGVYNIPVDDPRYGEHLDSDGDGVACENPTYGPAVPPDTTLVGDPEDMFEGPVTPLAEEPPPIDPIPAPESAPVPDVEPVPLPGAPAAGTNAGVNLDSGIPAEKDDPAAVAGVAGAAVLASAGGVLLYRRARA